MALKSNESIFKRELEELIIESNQNTQQIEPKLPGQAARDAEHDKKNKMKKCDNFQSSEDAIWVVFYCDGDSKRSSRMLKYFETHDDTLRIESQKRRFELGLLEEGYLSFEGKFGWFCQKSGDLTKSDWNHSGLGFTGESKPTFGST